MNYRNKYYKYKNKYNKLINEIYMVVGKNIEI